MDYEKILKGTAKERAFLPGIVFGVLSIIFAVLELDIKMAEQILTIELGVFLLGFLVTIVIGYYVAKDVKTKGLVDNIKAGALGGIYFGFIFGILGIIAAAVSGVGTMATGAIVLEQFLGQVNPSLWIIVELFIALISLVFGILFGLVLGGTGGLINHMKESKKGKKRE